MKKLLFIPALVFLIASCGTTSKFNKNLNKLELGMSKQQVVSVMGKKYRTIGAVNTPDGNIDSWRYYEENVVLGEPGDQIRLNFLDGRLVEWFRDIPNQNHIDSRVVVDRRE